ncbi:MAG TPA: SpoIIE family protein phosphatase, partial [Acidimicrobiales bacterium]|nr:SpoIIE family protein phosphatase [Acidimicrobiales bacterium]
LLLGPPSRRMGDGKFGHLLGVMPAPVWTATEVPLGAGARLLLYTDGLIEGRVAPASSERVGLDGLITLIDNLVGSVPNGDLAETALLDGLLAEVVRRNGGPLSDDVALCLVSIPSPTDG